MQCLKSVAMFRVLLDNYAELGFSVIRLRWLWSWLDGEDAAQEAMTSYSNPLHVQVRLFYKQMLSQRHIPLHSSILLHNQPKKVQVRHSPCPPI